MTITHRLANRTVFFVVLIAILLFAAGALMAQIETRTGDHVDASEAFPDMAFFAGANLNVTAKSTDDLFAAGADITISEAQADHMITAGGDIVISDVAFHDLIAAGGDINFVSGVVTDDLVAAGGDLSVQSGFNIGGSAVLSGGDVDIEAPIGAELRAAGGRLRLNAGVEGDAHLVGGDITLGPAAKIGGDLRYRAKSIDISPDAVISGEVIELESPTPPDFEKLGVAAAAAITGVRPGIPDRHGHSCCCHFNGAAQPYEQHSGDDRPEAAVDPWDRLFDRCGGPSNYRCALGDDFWRAAGVADNRDLSRSGAACHRSLRLFYGHGRAQPDDQHSGRPRSGRAHDLVGACGRGSGDHWIDPVSWPSRVVSRLCLRHGRRDDTRRKGVSA